MRVRSVAGYSALEMVRLILQTKGQIFTLYILKVHIDILILYELFASFKQKSRYNVPGTRYP
jgi:hypothetical protein